MRLGFLRNGWIGLMTASIMFAQATGGKPGGGAVSGGGVPNANTPINSRNSTTTLPSTQQPGSGQMDLQRPIYLSGKVTLDDGTPPSEPVNLELACGGSRRTVGYTDGKGRFSIDLTSRFNNGVIGDASQTGSGRMSGVGSMTGANQIGNQGGMNNGASELMLNGCDLQAALPGYRSDLARLGNRRAMDSPEIGTIILHRLGNVEGLTISATSAMAPQGARKAYEKARSELLKGKTENAQRELEKAVDAYPKYAAAWFQLGLIQQKSDVEAARKSYTNALAADPRFVSPYHELALLAVKEGKWEEVAQDTSRLLKLNPVDFPIAWFYNAYANYRLQNLEAAEKSARAGVSADSSHRTPKMDQLLGVILAEKKDFPGASEHLKNYLRLVPDATDAETVKKQLADLDKLISPEVSAKEQE